VALDSLTFKYTVNTTACTKTSPAVERPFEQPTFLGPLATPHRPLPTTPLS